jgi:hypothetical protein
VSEEDLLMVAGVLVARNRSLKEQIRHLKQSRGRVVEIVESNRDEKLEPLFEQLQEVIAKLERFSENLPLEKEALGLIIKELKGV